MHIDHAPRYWTPLFALECARPNVSRPGQTREVLLHTAHGHICSSAELIRFAFYPTHYHAAPDADGIYCLSGIWLRTIHATSQFVLLTINPIVILGQRSHLVDQRSSLLRDLLPCPPSARDIARFWFIMTNLRALPRSRKLSRETTPRRRSPQ